ncbi:Cytochrome P450 monooxygenase orf2 [Fulvia fulva]|uniref:Cytochrome P450 monooxygenase orf2 n=1 Tax=Passalora fulva TaxID=5499 RepID=A0A9Q8P961_PASFU|nr:Cytochrome P450 monooxygenase orf2 [Fulvia fulva]KAK4624547.1 Cytochrome P450 monooxygenase orf2 [Fulvia fulva]KAK4624966.1 Cytochrome P450 monooxygenase orf2 [Fulvia fulva]UJO17717.1 Cytochrome P450 monooxygenase orf2 [Fulvia fulva]WPV14671.1 Cytochrome P450 monooxygenase orf2 [Fulvia fulva]WPV30226.1 Cytochrome P450 monooxygenase orf2 [Fulvia fulva]
MINIPVTAALALLCLAVYKFFIYPTVLSSLAKIPNAHWSSSLSPAWILYHRQRQDDTTTVHAAHQRLGPIIRLAPNEISINSVDGGIRSVYAGGFEKGSWYSNVFSNYGVEPMFAMEGHSEHSKRKRMLSNVYAKSTLQSSASLTKQTDVLIKERLYPRLKAAADSEEPIELYDVFSAVTMDFVSGYIFGMNNGSDFIRDEEAGIKLFHDFKARQKYTFWPQEMAAFTQILEKVGLKWLVVPKWVDQANQEIEDWLIAMCDRAEQTIQMAEAGEKVRTEDHPTVYSQLRNTLSKDASRQKGITGGLDQSDGSRIRIASELLDHTLAGFDTSGITLTWLAWQLSRADNAPWQRRLQAELATLDQSLDAKSIDNLPVLHATIMETLRLHAAIPGNQPRITPQTTTTLGDAEAGIMFTNLPPGIRVQAQAWSLHRNPRVFPEPEVWNPERWLNEQGELRNDPRMARWFWAFGSGGRMCVGSNLAMLDMKATVVGIWSKFSTEVADDEGMVPNGGYMAEPLGVGPGGKKGIGKGRKFLRCRLTEA